jgi:hypothetical protein
MKRRVAILAVLLAMMAFSPMVYATPLAPGGSVVPTLLTDPPGTLEATVNTTFTSSPFSPPITGNFNQEVYRISGGTLDFYYQFSNTTTAEFIAQQANASFQGFTTDVFIRTDDPDAGGPLAAGGVAPQSAFRSSNGVTTTFDFGLVDPHKVGPGQTSAILVIRTDATAFAPGASSVIDGSAANIPDNAPTSAVPEPASLLLLGSGFLALGAYRARLRAAQKR